MGVDYRFYVEPESCADFEQEWFGRPCNEQEEDIKPKADKVKSLCFKWNGPDNEHTLTFDFHENGVGFIVDTSVRRGSKLMDQYITFVVNKLLAHGDLYVSSDCSFYNDDVEYARQHKKLDGWLPKDSSIRSLHNFIYGLKEGSEHAL